MATEIQNTATVQNVPLDQFIRLDAVLADGTEVVKRGSMGVRNLKHQHVLELAHSDHTQWPNLEAALKPEGIILIDGYHRLEAAILKPELMAKEHIEGENNVEPVVITSLPVNVRTYESDTAIVKTAIRANLRHGLAASEQSRTTLGLLLLLEMRDNGEKPRFTEAATEVGISKVTLFQAWSKLLDAEAKAEGESEEATEGESEEGVSSEDFEKAAKSFVSSMRKLYKASSDMTDASIASDVASLLTKNDDIVVLATVINVLKETAKKAAKKPTAKKTEVKKPELTQPTLPEAPSEEVKTPEAVAEEAPQPKAKKAKKAPQSEATA